ncbi:hypothetical protein M407DRAFT_31126 [Tulasnella calospora MUT 4182]|uniref:PARP-type domain-containing protein n=1 Tax=Tulasnella calospora MUT 4182 TaxID=1051891 RepID=A0A0C3PW63_9AGAM|nr:hypothetical protein M407DRAFT_31126 [Tulasnella calospora MUT 4182]
MPYKVGYAPRGGSQCSVCTNKSAKAIPAGDLQFGVFYVNDGQEQLTWRHLFCVNSTQMKNIAKVYPFGKGIVDYDTLTETDQGKIKNFFEQYTGPLNSFEDALKAQGRRYTFAEESEIQPAPSERAKSPVEGSEVEGPAWGLSEPRSPSTSSAAPPLSATPSVAPPRYNARAVASNQRPYRPSVETSGASFSNQERDDLTISELGLSLVDLDIATARVEHAAAVVGVERAKKKSVEWELSRFRRRSETSGFSTPMHEQVEGLELQVIQAELKVAEAESKLAEARIRKEEAKRAVIALQLAEVRKEGK